MLLITVHFLFQNEKKGVLTILYWILCSISISITLLCVWTCKRSIASVMVRKWFKASSLWGGGFECYMSPFQIVTIYRVLG